MDYKLVQLAQVQLLIWNWQIKMFAQTGVTFMKIKQTRPDTCYYHQCFNSIISQELMNSDGLWIVSSPRSPQIMVNMTQSTLESQMMSPVYTWVYIKPTYILKFPNVGIVITVKSLRASG